MPDSAEAGPPHLKAGPAHFIVDEDPAYAASGSGEHLYVRIEKEGLTTDQVAEALGKACGVGPRAVGYAGRKDRWGITRQWFSVLVRSDAGLAHLAEHLPRQGRVQVLEATRHGNKLRLGHLSGNRFLLGLGGIDASAEAALRARLAELVRTGVPNRFGAQRFGHGGATLRLARAWSAGDLEAAIGAVVDPAGCWSWGQPLPEGFRHGPEGRVLGALRRGAAPADALAAGGEPLRQLAASAGQSAIFNGVFDARAQAGILHRPRVGDVAQTGRGGLFLISQADLADAERRAAAGTLEIALTGPLPPCDREPRVSDAVEAEERAWSSACAIDWGAFARGRPLESPGERRALIARLRAEPVLVRAEQAAARLELALPSGCYATEVLAALGVAVPADRR